MRQSATKPDPHRSQRRVLQAVALFEFFKGIFVVLMGFCALALVHKDVWLYAESLLALFHISTDRKSAQLFLDFADNVTDARLWAAARIAFAYSALRFTEAYGLWHSSHLGRMGGAGFRRSSAAAGNPRTHARIERVARRAAGRKSRCCSLHALRHSRQSPRTAECRRDT